MGGAAGGAFGEAAAVRRGARGIACQAWVWPDASEAGGDVECAAGQ